MPAHKSPWLKRVLIPFWTLQLLILLAEITIQSIQINLISPALLSSSSLAIIGTVLGLTCLFALLKIIEIILFATHRLSPPTLLLLQLLPTTAFTALLVAQIIVAFAAVGGGRYQYRANYAVAGSVVVDGVILAVFLGMLIYAGVIYHRYRVAKRVGRERDPDFYHHSYRAIGGGSNRDENGGSSSRLAAGGRDVEVGHEVGMQVYR